MTMPLRMLQVEDSESDASLIVRLLEKAGYDVQCQRVERAGEMEAALASDAWDVIVADYHLPHFDAPSALAVLHASGMDIPFLVVSGAVGEDRAVAMMKSGAQDFLMKSNLARLAPAVEREIKEAGIRRERKLADEALRIARLETEASHQLLDAVFSAQIDGVLVHNAAGIVVRTNPAAVALCGFDPTGMSNAAILQKMKLPAGPCGSVTQRALEGETVFSVEQAAAERIFETCSSPMRDVAGHVMGAVTIIRNISEKKRAEQRLQQAEKLESIGLLAGGIAHDFNNILTVVGGNIALALDDACPDCQLNSGLQCALESVRRAAGLTRQLLAYAGKGDFVRKPVSASQVAAQAVGLLLPSLPQRIRLHSDLAPGLPPLLMDPGQLEQVFSNLILNAVEAIGDTQSGIVTIRTSLEDDSLRIEVSDDGCGMDPEMQKRIFDPFFTTKFQGRGLGLAAVEGIVRALDGRIAVESAVGRGTRIEVLLPVPKSTKPAPAAAACEPVSDARYGAVLIVDDEPLIRKMAATFLKKRGIPVLEASTGREAIERLTTEGASVRAILLDIAMPEMSGDSALAVIHKLRPDVRMIVSTGHLDNDVKEQFSSMGACSFLPKPYTREQLLTLVLSAVNVGEPEA